MINRGESSWNVGKMNLQDGDSTRMLESATTVRSAPPAPNSMSNAQA